MSRAWLGRFKAVMDCDAETKNRMIRPSVVPTLFLVHFSTFHKLSGTTKPWKHVTLVSEPTERRPGLGGRNRTPVCPPRPAGKPQGRSAAGCSLGSLFQEGTSC